MTKKSLMFPFVSGTLNPIGGACEYNCTYCWARKLVKRYKLKKYTGKPYLIIGELEKSFVPGAVIFVGDMIDIFAETVPEVFLDNIFRVVEKYPKTDFLFLTKNPERYLELLRDGVHIPENCILGATIESNRYYPDISRAPKQAYRVIAMQDLHFNFDYRLFISIEPILDFDLIPFVNQLEVIEPWKIAVGYDNYHNKLKEPTLSKTRVLIECLKQFTDVVVKTLRPAWYENKNLVTLCDFEMEG
ncbi:MAG: DUF5131 family protein [Candidatus Odinarchaeota archaeon]|nr:DUF5131 family protein [Candidatus Odinarchaeota archaeon]